MLEGIAPEHCKKRVHVSVAKKIAIQIISGEFEEHQKLPCEFDLCEQHGISRTALRESMKLLSAKGLLCSKPKIGTRVQSREMWHFMDAQLLEWIHETNKMKLFLNQFLGLRKAIEPEASALSSLNATVEERMELAVIFQSMVAASETDDMEAWIEQDMKFHCQIFKSTGNLFYVPFANILPTILRTFIDNSAQGGRYCIQEHAAIYDAVMAGNPQKARVASKALLADENQRLSVVTA
ncbi:FadR family transcriptional regulator [Vibrio sp. JC009]|uniref:FadR/GntR family transcriptional regulator n=1 Tax=Vibrio sp. JC009 TaxID=2912314 RepID=UPI0023B1BB10|nr:FadR/GntR family transcriptional regulator [Vibrio sp. JC009]WED24116.1 FadR family transcriptional regulator [Vibrio sp. JC009]